MHAAEVWSGAAAVAAAWRGQMRSRRPRLNHSVKGDAAEPAAARQPGRSLHKGAQTDARTLQHYVAGGLSGLQSIAGLLDLSGAHPSQAQSGCHCTLT